MKNRTKRLGRLGNAVVPQCAEYLGRLILAFDLNRELYRCAEINESQKVSDVAWLNAISDADCAAEQSFIRAEMEGSF